MTIITSRPKRKSRTSIGGALEQGLDCVVIAAAPDRAVVEVELASGETLSARCPGHVPIHWLRAAVVIAPVEATMLRSAGVLPTLLAIFPSARHESVRAAVHIHASTMTIDASDEVELHSGGASVSLKSEGEGVVVRGRDLLSEASEVNRVQGGRVRIN